MIELVYNIINKNSKAKEITLFKDFPIFKINTIIIKYSNNFNNTANYILFCRKKSIKKLYPSSYDTPNLMHTIKIPLRTRIKIGFENYFVQFKIQEYDTFTIRFLTNLIYIPDSKQYIIRDNQFIKNITLN